MLNNILQILEVVGVLMKSFTLNHGPEQYSQMLLNIREGASEEEVAKARQIPRAKMPNKLDGPMMLIPIVPKQQHPATRPKASPLITVVVNQP